MASGLCAALTGRTHGCTDQPANVKKTLANSEPSTHGTKRTYRHDLLFVRFRGWSQRVDATLYPERERWSVRQCVEVIFEALRHQRKQSFGIAGSGASR